MMKVTMLSSAEKVKGQGVASAYRELINLLQSQTEQSYDLAINRFRRSDITHYHTIDFRFFLTTFFKRTGVKVGYVHFLPETVDESLSLPKPIRALFYHYMVSFYKRMDDLIVVNPSFIPKLVALGLDQNKIHYIPNFVSRSSFSASKKSTVRTELGIPEDAFVVLGAGQIQHRKGVKDFLDVASQRPDIHFIWAGGFSFGKLTAGYHELKAYVDQPPTNVHFPGIVPRENMQAYYNACNLFFSPSYNELFPMTILEAMSCEKPLLLRGLALYEDILFDYYVTGDSNKSFIEQIDRLREDNHYYQHARNLSKKGAYVYSEERLTTVWNQFYRDVHGVVASSSHA
ncbi:glycosyltransferase family 4 protein [Shouchella lehensis]|nr:glycosyltransferase family 4 protein [Shouchella lehensis]